MTTTADALEVMTLVVACHHRTAPRMDDREATLATATIWAELFSQYKLELPDLIAGVKRRALSHADAPEPAEIIAVARDIRRERGERETPTERRAREDRQDAALEARNQAKLAAITGGLGKAIE
ncbi:hypothetical protein A5784_14020 [Mycobacterium sp. 852013-50091_SCH5140682]|uniref:hypothetical protein n=1 Tax=Mycobacterium sp. 852013-50091_SCH5140682 TaxID=1834109 RepID=UPI0007E9F2BB|nr:hypothetical protein [Mycobacterium sp. 852013-50091_SCH5140682]OBC03351.1 hypothetical protein A5784_14020 [Mycobacterium sp. 852013-50091_SCH5140682]